jgi:predicted lipoprotein with Yx(FWY)xxD motif
MAKAAGGLLVAAALILSACGGSDDNEATAGSGGNETVSVAMIGDAGSVLVDSGGRALYSPAQEANGKILCTGSCEAIWKPLTAPGGTPSASTDVSGELGTVKRPGGDEQVTLDGAPLYTFTQEGANEVTGDGLADSFGGQDFTWHVLSADGSTGGSSQSSTTTSSDSGGYSY